MSNTNINCCICGTVKNCAPYLKKVFENISKIGEIFAEYTIVVFYDKSTDNTLNLLYNYQKQNSRLKIMVNKEPLFQYRTHNIARGRNHCLRYVKKHKDMYPYFIMMDFDDVNAKHCNVDVIRKYLLRNDWDSLSFQTSPHYYDIWALSIYPFCFSYNHFKHSVKFYSIIQRYMDNMLQQLKDGQLLQCISAFNGFAIYRTEKFLNTYYDGRIRIDLIPHANMMAHMKATRTYRIQYIKYPTVDGHYEDCEHRAFHIMATQNSNARIRISPEIVFS